ncbi:MAG TPA: hypothetical protein ENH30_06330 [Nitrospirae bacterium]|nr:hypothetical protein [Nitrospirota bacterium]
MKKVLFICGSLNQTTIMHKISQHLSGFDCYFTPYYGDGLIKLLNNYGVLDFTVMGGRFRQQTDDYLKREGVKIDYRGSSNDYDLVVTCQDLIIQKNIRKKKIVLVQEGMTDPENLIYRLVKRFKLPRYLASTAATGLSDAYDKFCVASEGYGELFMKKGVNPEKIVVTGIPNFDNVLRYLDNSFPHKGYVLVGTSDTRETFKFDNRKRFLKRVLSIARGRKLIFKLHPNESIERSKREIKKHAPNALVFSGGDINPMIANCDVLITQYSSVAFIGLALGKEVHSYFDVEQLKKLLPIQNGGTSAKKIAGVCRGYL